MEPVFLPQRQHPLAPDYDAGVMHAPESCYPEYGEWLDYLKRSVTTGSPVLDLGCGCGVPGTSILAESFDVTGVDISEVQIQTARRLVPSARFFCGDMTKLSFLENSFAGVVSFYAIIHVPIWEQRRLFRRIASWLVPGGYFMATVGHKVWGWTGLNPSEEGAGSMAWSHAGRETYLQWITELGFYVHFHRYIPERSGGQTLVCCSKVARENRKSRRRTIFDLSRSLLGESTALVPGGA